MFVLIGRFDGLGLGGWVIAGSLVEGKVDADD